MAGLVISHASGCCDLRPAPTPAPVCLLLLPSTAPLPGTGINSCLLRSGLHTHEDRGHPRRLGLPRLITPAWAGALTLLAACCCGPLQAAPAATAPKAGGSGPAGAACGHPRRALCVCAGLQRLPGASTWRWWVGGAALPPAVEKVVDALLPARCCLLLLVLPNLLQAAAALTCYLLRHSIGAAALQAAHCHPGAAAAAQCWKTGEVMRDPPPLPRCPWALPLRHCRLPGAPCRSSPPWWGGAKVQRCPPQPGACPCARPAAP